MADLNAFIQQNVEGYLFADLREMQRIPVGYPLLMTSFAGIELLGALGSTSPFDTGRGAVYFSSYWTAHLYPKLKDSPQIGDVLYQLVRHGIAHGFVLKGPMGVVRGMPSRHLTRDAEGLILIDAVQLSDDIMTSFAASFKPLLTATSGSVNASTIGARLAEMDAEYRKQAARLSVASLFQGPTLAATAAVSHSTAAPPTSVAPGAGGASGSVGP